MPGRAERPAKALVQRRTDSATTLQINQNKNSSETPESHLVRSCFDREPSIPAQSFAPLPRPTVQRLPFEALRAESERTVP